MTMQDDRLLKVKEVAETLQVCTRLVWKLRARGILPAVKFGRATCFRMSDVQKLVREGVPKP